MKHLKYDNPELNQSFMNRASCMNFSVTFCIPSYHTQSCCVSLEIDALKNTTTATKSIAQITFCIFRLHNGSLASYEQQQQQYALL
jgi:hypothetical protein